MKDFTVIITTTEIAYVNAESEEQAIELIRAKLPARAVVDIQVAKEVILDEVK